MKYYIYCYLWKDNSGAIQFATGCYGPTRGISGMYEHVARQSGSYCLTSVHEISENEFNKVKKNGIIG